ncbi:MAG TPA: D-glycero-beta-D-manno-heptose-7-phosphate kinase, partial [Bacteroidales bacterium]|nr:D-glycero-beta-D-manno-heptose-7-phosphate kinase [Bacteroidales bacterium]
MTYDANWYHKLFDGFKDLRVLIIGDVMIDAYIRGQVDRISPEAPVPVVMVGKKTSRLGGAANVALNIKSMGATPLLCSVIGEDVRGDEFIHLLCDEAIFCDGIIRSNDRKTTTKSRIIGNNVQMLRVDEEAIHPLIEEDEARLLQLISHLLTTGKPHAIIFQDYDKGVLTPTLIGEVIRKATVLGIPVTVDPKRNQFRSYKGVTLFKPNFKELLEGTGTHLPKGYSVQLEEAVARLREEMNAEQVMVTLSEDGVYYHSKSGINIESGHVQAH